LFKRCLPGVDMSPMRESAGRLGFGGFRVEWVGCGCFVAGLVFRDWATVLFPVSMALGLWAMRGYLPRVMTGRRYRVISSSAALSVASGLGRHWARHGGAPRVVEWAVLVVLLVSLIVTLVGVAPYLLRMPKVHPERGEV
jgi:hypothetical protein